MKAAGGEVLNRGAARAGGDKPSQQAAAPIVLPRRVRVSAHDNPRRVSAHDHHMRGPPSA